MSQTPDPQELGSRAEELLGELRSEAGPGVSARAEELVRLLVELYGAGLERVVAIVSEDPAGPTLLDRLARDDLVAGLLILHDLHPVPAAERLRAALDRLGARIGSTLELVGVDEDGVAHVRAAPGCGGALSAEDRAILVRAVEETAPDLSGVELDAQTQAPTVAFIPVGSLRRKEVAGTAGRVDDGARRSEARS